jgi:O-antigen ligase/polysaccharide polymerase Wzy-like membrane protein
MQDPAFTQKLKSLLLACAGLLLAIFIGTKVGASDYRPLVLGTLGLLGCAFALFSGRFFWVITIASGSLAGTFPVLGGKFTPFQILMVIGIAKFLIEDVVLRRTKIKTGNRTDLLLMAGFMVILTYHGVHDRFGMRFLGSNVWGGANYVNVYVGLIAFFIIQSIPMKSSMWAKLPYLVLAISAFDLMIALITTIFPNTIYKIYPFYSAVSRSGVEGLVTGGAVETTRLGSAGNFGLTLITLVLAATSLRKILHPSNFFRVVTLAIGGLAVLLSSFRSAVFNTVAIFFVAGIRDLKWAVLVFLPLLGVLLFGLSFINSEVVALPKAVQRSLTFIPGSWDIDMKQDSVSSNQWRGEIWSQFLQEYFPRQPWIGRGFGFRSEWAARSVYRYDPEANRQTIEVGNLHNGFLSSLDTFGMVGTFFFIAWNIRLLFRTFQVRLRKDDPAGLALPYLALSFGASIICYWMSAASVGASLGQEFAVASVFLRLLNDRQAREAAAAAPLPAPENVRDGVLVGSAQGAG